MSEKVTEQEKSEVTEEKRKEIDQYLEELVGKYVEAKENEKYYKNLATEISNNVDEVLHFLETNSKQIFISAIGKNYECKYVDRSTKKTDYVRLTEIVSQEVYDEVVSENISTYLQIRPAAEKKPIKREKPIPGSDKLVLPKAKIMK
jgi:hypothetical protein